MLTWMSRARGCLWVTVGGSLDPIVTHVQCLVRGVRPEKPLPCSASTNTQHLFLKRVLGAKRQAVLGEQQQEEQAETKEKEKTKTGRTEY